MGASHGIVFGRWELRPVDTMNWALATTEQWEKRKASKGKGVVPSQARYYQWPNIGYAVHYAAMRDFADKVDNATPWEAAEELTRTCETLLAECIRSLDKHTHPSGKTPTPAAPKRTGGK